MAAGKKDTLTLETTRKAVCLKAVILQWLSCGGEKKYDGMWMELKRDMLVIGESNLWLVSTFGFK